MSTSVECVCCREVERFMEKMQEDNIDQQCVTLHPGFSAVCLNTWVLQAAYFNYRQKYGTEGLSPYVNE